MQVQDLYQVNFYFDVCKNFVGILNILFISKCLILFSLRRAVEVKEAAEKKKIRSGELDKPQKVTLAHVASVCSEVYGSRFFVDICYLP